MHPLVAVSYFFGALGLFFAGLGVLLWGTGKMRLGEAAKAEAELKERQYNYERTKGKEGTGSPTR